MSTNDSTSPSIPPGEIANWPLLKIVYRTDPDKIADLLPPGIEPGRGAERARQHLQRAGEGRAGVRRRHQGRRDLRRHGGLLRHRPRDRPGVGDLHQPGAERPAEVPVLDRLLPPRRRRRGALHAPGLHVHRVPRARHRRRRRPVRRVLRETTGGSSRRVRSAASRRATTSRRTSCASRARATPGTRRSSTATSCCATARGTRTPSCCRCASSCRRTSCGSIQKTREITLAGPLDPIAFWPYADTIGGSRWPGDRGGPRFQH